MARAASTILAIGDYMTKGPWLLLSLVSAGCSETEVSQVERDLVFQEVEAPDRSAFVEHWTRGPQSAWYSSSARQVLVVDESGGPSLRISGFPAGLGSIVATGWDPRHAQQFFVHLTHGADQGTMVYLDLDARRALGVEHWNAW